MNFEPIQQNRRAVNPRDLCCGAIGRPSQRLRHAAEVPAGHESSAAELALETTFVAVGSTERALRKLPRATDKTRPLNSPRPATWGRS